MLGEGSCTMSHTHLNILNKPKHATFSVSGGRKLRQRDGHAYEYVHKVECHTVVIPREERYLNLRH